MPPVHTQFLCLPFPHPPLSLCTARDTRLELYLSASSGSLLDEAKRWFEAATVICRFVPAQRSTCGKGAHLQTPTSVESFSGTDRPICPRTCADIDNLRQPACSLCSRLSGLRRSSVRFPYPFHTLPLTSLYVVGPFVA
jgi:hypothetical protein